MKRDLAASGIDDEDLEEDTDIAMVEVGQAVTLQEEDVEMDELEDLALTETERMKMFEEEAASKEPRNFPNISKGKSCFKYCMISSKIFVCRMYSD